GIQLFRINAAGIALGSPLHSLEYHRQTFQDFCFPFGNRNGIYLILLAELGQCFLVLDRLQGNLGLELGAESASCLLCHGLVNLRVFLTKPLVRFLGSITPWRPYRAIHFVPITPADLIMAPRERVISISTSILQGVILCHGQGLMDFLPSRRISICYARVSITSILPMHKAVCGRG